MTIVHPLDLSAVRLGKGAHDPNEDGEWCLLEAAAYMAGEPWSDHPTCVSPVVAAFGRRWNDDLDDDGRQQLVALLPKMLGTNTGPGDDQVRGWMAADWLVRHYLPAWLDLAGLTEQAATVRAIGPLHGPALDAGVRATLRAVRSDASNARAKAYEKLKEKMAADAADAAGAAGAAGAAEAAGAAWAAWAAEAAIQPTADTIVDSAIDLFDRLIDARVEVPA